MRISHFFIDRPIFAAVISIVLVLLGGVSFLRLPVAQYPDIAPPVINVSGQYPGASAEIVAATVVAPRRGGASRANSPRPVGRMNSSPSVNRTKNIASHSQLTGSTPPAQLAAASRR